jgi:hypothetical protein
MPAEDTAEATIVSGVATCLRLTFKLAFLVNQIAMAGLLI